MRDVGKYFTVNYMLAEGIGEAPHARVTKGISYHRVQLSAAAGVRLSRAARSVHDCSVQMGGSDQWGNITAGVDLIRKLRGSKAHGLVLPLITDGIRARSSARPRRARCGSIQA